MRVSGIPLMQISGKRFTPTRKLSAYLFSHHDEFPDFTLRRTRASSSIMSLFYSTLFVFYTIYLLFSFHGAKIQIFYQLLSNQLRFDNTVNHNNVLFHMEDIHPLLVMGDHPTGFGVVASNVRITAHLVKVGKNRQRIYLTYHGIKIPVASCK